MLHFLNDSQCYIVLECTGFGQNVNLSWAPDGEFNGSYISGIPKSVVSPLVLFSSFSGNRNVTFNCTASSGQQTVTRQMTVGCSGGSHQHIVASLGCCTLHIKSHASRWHFQIQAGLLSFIPIKL